mmetsp:Transcript_139214/g.388466  ORF Transcript_139214/g.388466 Transcript_139214/m.388466 type:complete len:379 (-) Transcript_139214:315-1451(-)
MAALGDGAAIREVVVCGGGIVGCATAYFLSAKGIHVTVVERCGIACAASGKAGGFLARGWGSGPTEALHHQGFDLHAKLAADLSLQSYRRLPTLSVDGSRRARKPPSEFPWVDLASSQLMDKATAHVHPAEITHRLFEAAAARGAALVTGAVEGVRRTGDQVTAVVVDGKDVPCDAVVFAMGPWSVMVESWLPEARVPMEGILSTSLVFRLPSPVEPPCALFCDEDEYGCHLEVNPRVDSTVYVCGCGGSAYLSGEQIAALKPEEVVPDPKRVKAATESLQSKTSVTGNVVPEAGACMRPCLRDARPSIGRVVGNAFIACGHNCWGILWGPLTGQMMAEVVLGGESPVPLAAFEPGRFPAPRSKRGRHLKDMPVGEQW